MPLLAGGVAALLASTCCLGPLLLLGLGFSGAWIGSLTALEPYRPLFIGASMLALGLAARRIWRPELACAPGRVCAVPRTVTLSVPTMDCPVCPITVKRALGKVPGVSRTVVDFDKRIATVTYDDAKASVDALIRATRDAGYPSSLREATK